MPTVRANGIDLYHERLGRGAPLLWLNGSGSTIAQIAPLLDPYSAHFDVLIHDQRGLGRTEVPAGPYSMADYAADALALLDVVGWERTRVLGISFGGMVAQELAVTAPDRIERLALLCTSPGGEGGSSYPLHELGALAPEDRARRHGTLLDTRFDEAWLAEHPNDKALVDLMGARPEPTQGAVLQLEARRDHDVWDRLDRVTCPTLVASGRYDGIAAPENGEAIASRIPGAELRLFEGGHMFMVQDRAATRAVIDFLLQDS
ncbi:MAG: alpha/beta fold hydrolase [Acidimicrobiales bacterium]